MGFVLVFRPEEAKRRWQIEINLQITIEPNKNQFKFAFGQTLLSWRGKTDYTETFDFPSFSIIDEIHEYV